MINEEYIKDINYVVTNNTININSLQRSINELDFIRKNLLKQTRSELIKINTIQGMIGFTEGAVLDDYEKYGIESKLTQKLVSTIRNIFFDDTLPEFQELRFVGYNGSYSSVNVLVFMSKYIIMKISFPHYVITEEEEELYFGNNSLGCNIGVDVSCNTAIAQRLNISPISSTIKIVSNDYIPVVKEAIINCVKDPISYLTQKYEDLIKNSRKFYTQDTKYLQNNNRVTV